MGVETPIEGIWSLNVNWPLTGESRRQGDDHFRLIKDAILKTFAAINEPITVTDEELNILAGMIITTAELNALDGIDTGQTIQAQIDDTNIARLNIANVFTESQIIKDSTSASIFYVQPGSSAMDISGHGFLIRRNNGTYCAFLQAVPDSNKFEVILYNASGAGAAAVFRATYGAKLLTLTATDLTWGGNAVALQSDVNSLHSLTALKTDFMNSSVAVVGNNTNDQWRDTGFGNNDFQFGFATDYYNRFTPAAFVARTNDNRYIQFGDVTTITASVSQPPVGQISFKSNVSGNVYLWARKNI